MGGRLDGAVAEASGCGKRADVQQLRVRVVAHRWPVRPAHRVRQDHGQRSLEDRREDGRRLDRSQPLRRRVLCSRLHERFEVGIGHLLLNHRRIARERLRLRRRLVGALRNRSFCDSVERLAVRPVEDVRPTCLARLRNRMPQPASHLDVEEHDRTGRVVIPDVVMDLLEVPAVLACRRVDRHDRAREEVVAGPGVAVVVG